MWERKGWEKGGVGERKGWGARFEGGAHLLLRRPGKAGKKNQQPLMVKTKTSFRAKGRLSWHLDTLLYTSCSTCRQPRHCQVQIEKNPF